jgi:hypothetical protein
MTAIQLSLLGGEQSIRTSDDYYTPRWIFDTLGLIFDLDVACPPEGPINVPATRWYTAADDGLAQPWSGRVWMNPPYSKPAPWVARFIEHGHGVALLPVMTNGKWLHDLWNSSVSLTLLTRLKFERLDGQVASSYPGTIGLWAFGDECVDAISRFGRAR